jgi:hypothetical protein
MQKSIRETDVKLLRLYSSNNEIEYIRKRQNFFADGKVFWYEKNNMEILQKGLLSFQF